jgi:hypothetical protein
MSSVPFFAYASDCLVDARLKLPDNTRLTDFLNSAADVALTFARLTALDDGRVVSTANLTLVPAELLAVEATDAVGTSGHRIRTRLADVEIVVGPYRIQGFVHGPSAGDPLASISRRQTMVPVTNAKIAYMLAGTVRVRECEAIIVNRLNANFSEPDPQQPSILDRLGLQPVDPHAKDLSGELRGAPRADKPTKAGNGT